MSQPRSTIARWRPSIRASLALLVVGCVMPIAMVSAFLISNAYEFQRTAQRQDVVGHARAAVAVLDREFTSTQAALRTLGTSQRLARGELEGFHARAVESLPGMHADSIALMDHQGKLLLWTRFAQGSPLPAFEALGNIWQSQGNGQVFVSDLIRDPVTGELTYATGIPIQREGAATVLLISTSSVNRLADSLGELHLPTTWRSSIVDGHGNVAARSHGGPIKPNEKLGAEILNRMGLDNESQFNTVDRDGGGFSTVFSRAKSARWAVVLEIPNLEMDRVLQNRLGWLVLVTVAALSVGIAVAWLIGGRIAHSVRALAGPARALGAGDDVVVPSLFFEEADVVGKALRDTSQLLRHTKHAAHHDELTDLANRALFREIVSQQLLLCARSQSALTILFIDLDGFKSVNDTFGHAAGDQLLRMVSTRIAASIRGADIAARIGGDEFAIALIYSDAIDGQAFADKLIETISAPYPYQDHTLKVSASIGVVSYPHGGRDIDTLLKRADAAMYAAKAAGKGRAHLA